MATAAELASHKYMLLTTFRRDGAPVSSPVWVVGLGRDTIGFQTEDVSGKVKRLRNNADVTVQPCTARGKVLPNTEPTRATAEVVTGPAYDDIESRVDTKYGLTATAFGWFETLTTKIRRRPAMFRVGIIITIPSATGGVG